MLLAYGNHVLDVGVEGWSGITASKSTGNF